MIKDWREKKQDLDLQLKKQIKEQRKKENQGNAAAPDEGAIVRDRSSAKDDNPRAASEAESHFADRSRRQSTQDEESQTLAKDEEPEERDRT